MLNKVNSVARNVFKAIPMPVKRATSGVTSTLLAASIYGNPGAKAVAKEVLNVPVDAANKVVKVAAKPVIELTQDVFESTVK